MTTKLEITPPNILARTNYFHKNFGKYLSDLELLKIVKATENYSFADLQREALKKTVDIINLHYLPLGFSQCVKKIIFLSFKLFRGGVWTKRVKVHPFF